MSKRFKKSTFAYFYLLTGNILLTTYCLEQQQWVGNQGLPLLQNLSL